MARDAVGDAIRETLISPNVVDSNGEAANVVDVLQRIANGTGKIASAITPVAAPGSDNHGGSIESLTEAVMSAGRSLDGIAEAIRDLASAIRESS